MYATASTVRTGLNPRDADLRTWSTSSVAPDEATAYWRDVVRQLCVQMGIEPAPGSAFCGEIRRREYGDFALAVSRASGGTWRRTPSHIARGGDGEYLKCQEPPRERANTRTSRNHRR
jgi:hypothetical protein